MGSGMSKEPKVVGAGFTPDAWERFEAMARKVMGRKPIKAHASTKGRNDDRIQRYSSRDKSNKD